MSMEKRRDELGKLLACLLVSRKGASTIRDLETDYRENEGRNIPYKEFGCLSSLDFFRSISNHIKLVPGAGTYLVQPVVSDKIKHINELVLRQRPARRSTPSRRRPSRYSHWFPPVPDPKPFVPNTVQKEIAKILTSSRSGVDKSYIAQCLDQAEEVAGSVDSNNVDEYLTGMPYTAVSKGTKVYPSRALSAPSNISPARPKIEEVNGFEIVMPGESNARKESFPGNHSTRVVNEFPAGAEDGDDYYVKDDHVQPQFSKMNNNYATDNEYQSQQLSKADNGNKPRMSSAEFIHRAGIHYNQSQYDGLQMGSIHNVGENCKNSGKVEGHDEEEVNNLINEDCTFESDDDGSIDIINPRLKSRLQELIRKHPEGIWCANLLQTYLDEYKVPLDYVELGFESVSQLAANIPKVFHLHRQNSRGDFLLYDATKPLPPTAHKSESEESSNIWRGEFCDDDVDPFPANLTLEASRSLVPRDVMAHAETVGQEKIPDLCPGEECLEVYVADVITPSLFWIHLRKKRSKLSELMESMHDFYQREGDNYLIPHIILEKGLNCVCTYEDKWHRAIIKSVKPDGNVTLIFYDYGTTKTYPPDDLRFLVRQYSNLPAQAIACGLYNVKPIKADAWTRGVSREFYIKVSDVALVAIVVKIDRKNNSMLISLVNTHNEIDEHINDWLVTEGLAESGFMGDTVNLECSYLEDQISQVQDTTVGSINNMPLVSPQSTLPENSKSTLKPPPGLSKPTEPMNYAAFMDECWHRTIHKPADTGNSTFFNFCDVNMNSDSLNMAYGISYLQFIQLWKQQIELMDALNKFINSTRNASANNSTVLNNSNTISPTRSPTTGVNPFVEKTSKNPFKSDPEEIIPETTNITNSLDRSIDSLGNLTLNDSIRLNNLHSTTLPNVSSRESTLVGCEEKNVFSSKLAEGFRMARNQPYDAEDCPSIEIKLSNKTQFDVSQENVGGKIVHNEGFSVNELHDTNPFKQDIVPGFNSQVNYCKEQSLANDRPPIPPRNLNLVNKAGNIPSKNLTDATRTTSRVNNNLKNAPTPRIYYKADPVIYNLSNTQTDKTGSKPDNGTAKLTESVSFRSNYPYYVVNSSQDLKYHSSSHDTSLHFDKTNSAEGHPKLSQSGLDPTVSTTQANNISTQDTEFSTNDTNSLSPSFLPSSYRPSPPSYNHNNSTEYPCQKICSSSLQFASPTVSGNAEATIEGIADNFFVKMESSGTDTPIQNLDACEKQLSSSLITSSKTIPATTVSTPSSYCQNSARSSTPYKINLIMPKFLQGQQNAVSSEQELPDTLYQPINQESYPPTTAENSKLQWSIGDQATCNLNGTSSTNSEKSSYWRNTFETVIDKPTASLPTLHSPQNSVNEQPSITKNWGLTSNGDVTGDENSLKFSPPPPPNPRQYYRPMYPNIANLRHLTNHLYQMPPFDWSMQHQPVNPRVPLFRPNMHGIYPPGPHWQRPRFFNPRSPYAPQQLYLWNLYNSHMFARPQTPHVYRAAVPNSQKTYATDFSRKSVSSGLDHAQKVGEGDKELVNTVPNAETLTEVSDSINHITGQPTASGLTDSSLFRIPQELTNSHCNATANSKDCNSSTQLRKPNLRTPYHNVLNDRTEKFVEGGTTLNCSEKPLNRHVKDIPQCTSSRAATNVFKRVEVDKETIYLFNIQNEGWVSTEEIAVIFTDYENHDTIVRCLEIMDVQINFKEVSRAQSPYLFAELDGTSIKVARMKNSKRVKGPLHLTPLNSLIPMMYHLKLISPEEIHSMKLQKQLPLNSIIPKLLELIRAYKSNDEHWMS